MQANEPGLGMLNVTHLRTVNLTDQVKVSPALTALREATRDLHSELDTLSPLLRSPLPESVYNDHAARVLGWMAPLEQALWEGPAATLWPNEIQIAKRCGKVQWIEQDLLNAGYNAAKLAELEHCPYVPVPRTLAQSFGVAYVSEGATLGGAFLFKRLASFLPGLPLNWLKGYGVETGPLWTSFQRLLAQHVVSQESILEAQESARQAFQSFRCWVIDETPDAERSWI